MNYYTTSSEGESEMSGESRCSASSDGGDATTEFPLAAMSADNVKRRSTRLSGGDATTTTTKHVSFTEETKDGQQAGSSRGKGRGRPKGSKNKPRLKKCLPTEEAVPVEAASEILVEKIQEQVRQEQEALYQQKLEKQKMETVSKSILKTFDKNTEKARLASESKASTGVEWSGVYPDMPEAEFREKKLLLTKIGVYYKHKPALKDSNHRSSPWNYKVPIDKLKEEVLRCQSERNIEKAGEMLRKFDKTADHLIEKFLVNIAGQPAYGYAEESQATRSIIDDELNELTIKYCHFFDISPEVRLLLHKVTLLMNIIDRNSQQYQKTTVDQENTNRFGPAHQATRGGSGTEADYFENKYGNL